MPTLASVPSLAQESSEIVIAQLPGTSTSDDLLMHFEKENVLILNILFNFIFYSHLSSFFRSFIFSLNSYLVPKNVSDALFISSWTQSMQDKMTILEQNETWELVTLPLGKKIVGCNSVKLNSDGSLARLRRVWLPKDTYEYMDWTILIPFLQSWRYMCGFLCRQQWHTTGHFISWTSRCLSMVFLIKWFTWSNHHALLLKESVRRFAGWRSHFTVWKSLRAWFGWFASVIQELVFVVQRKITLCFGRYNMRRSY